MIVRYRRSGNTGSEGPWTEWTDPKHGLVEGWMSRVAMGINLFDQRIADFRNSPPHTVVSMLEQAGAPYFGAVPLNDKLADKLGLLEIYETVYRRGKALSIDGSPPRNDPGVNRQLQRFAGVLSDLYFLLANEAHSDAIDPTILIPSGNSAGGPIDIGDAHAFKGLTASLLEEELALLRGVNDSNVHEPPVFNRLRWNLTGDNLIQPLYVLNYGISEDNIGTLSEDSPEVRAELRKITDIAKKRYPQGHGDAYGHYLSALKVFYDLVRDEEFDWTVGSSITAIGSDAVEVDYFDERRFAQRRSGVRVPGSSRPNSPTDGTSGTRAPYPFVELKQLKKATTHVPSRSHGAFPTGRRASDRGHISTGWLETRWFQRAPRGTGLGNRPD